MSDYDNLFKIIEELVMHHSPSGVEAEINQFLMQRFATLGVQVWCDRADNIIAKIPGKNSDRAIAITAHKDEIGAIVKSVAMKVGWKSAGWAVLTRGFTVRVL
jgi:putative aminopeptidase FrvX